MSNISYLGRKISSFDSSPEFDGYTRVVITVSEDLEYAAGVETGRTLTMECPWGTQEMADNILMRIRGFQYQPYTARGASLDPAAELGDGLTVNNLYGGIYSMTTKFGGLCRAEVSAPAEEELDHEYPYVPKQERKVTRRLYSLSTELKVQAGLIAAEIEDRKSDVESINTQLTLQSGQIAAKVSKTGGSASSFGWVLDDSSWTIRANSRDILKATKAGLEVYGKVTATSGKIGGFDITANSLTYNNQTWGGTNSTGIYIGPQGIQCGSKGNGFQITNNGYLYAENGEFRGSVRAGNIQYGGSAGYFSGSGISSHSLTGNRLEYNTVGSSYVSSGINAGVAGGNWATDVFNGNDSASYVKADYLVCYDNFNFKGVLVRFFTRTFLDSDGNPVTIRYMGNY